MAGINRKDPSNVLEVVQLDGDIVVDEVNPGDQGGGPVRDGAVVRDILDGLSQVGSVLVEELLGRQAPRQDQGRPASGGRGGRRGPPPRNQGRGQAPRAPGSNVWKPKASRSWAMAPVVIVSGIAVLGAAGLAFLATRGSK